MTKQNVTLSIPKEILRQAKIVAIQRDKSLSGLMTELLVDLVESEARYDLAKLRSLRRLKEARDLNAAYEWSRDSLHDR